MVGRLRNNLGRMGEGRKDGWVNVFYLSISFAVYDVSIMHVRDYAR